MRGRTVDLKALREVAESLMAEAWTLGGQRHPTFTSPAIADHYHTSRVRRLVYLHDRIRTAIGEDPRTVSRPLPDPPRNERKPA